MKTGRKLFVAIVLFALSVNVNAFSVEDSIYYKCYVKTAAGDYVEETPPAAYFEAYLGGSDERILTHRTPRRPADASPNIDGNGVIGVELANFVDPTFSSGDNVTFRFVNYTDSQIGEYSANVTVPLFPLPPSLTVATVAEIPAPPRDVRLAIDDATGERVVSWKAESGLDYQVYRREVGDTIIGGRARMLYERVATDVADSSFTDAPPDTSKDYGYVVFALNASDVKSAASRDVSRETLDILDFAVEPLPNNAKLTWDDEGLESAGIIGFNIYRTQTPGEFSQDPIAYSSRDTFYVDTRLDLNTTYHYRVAGRTADDQEVAFTDDVSTTTLGSANGYHRFANLKVLVVFYKNTDRGSISPFGVSQVKESIDAANEFYWRNSGLRLNVEIDYLEFNDLKVIEDPENKWGSMFATAEHLAEVGVRNTQYDAIFRVTPAIGGFWSYGSRDLSPPLPGPDRNTGFSQVQWPIGSGVRHQSDLSSTNQAIAWTYFHEMQHAFDAIYADNDSPEWYHGDNPDLFPVPCGEHWDFQAKMMRAFEAGGLPGYLTLNEDWGDMYQAIDADNDGFPDEDARVPMDEARFGSSAGAADTDGDGLDDRGEYVAGTFSGADPNVTDTDGDGVRDGDDRHPRYPFAPYVPEFSPTIDGVIEEGWRQVVGDAIFANTDFNEPKIYANRDDDALYIAVETPRVADVEIYLDIDADGWWWGPNNTKIKYDPHTKTLEELWTHDASDSARAFGAETEGLWKGGVRDDDGRYISRFGRRIFYPADVEIASTNQSDRHFVEVRIAKNDKAGLDLVEGEKIAFSVWFTNIGYSSAFWATLFDAYSFETMEIGEPVAVRNDVAETPSEYALEQNYPNPFNPATTMRYRLPESADVALAIFNALGERVATIIDERQNAGVHEATWDGTDEAGIRMPSGVYFYSLSTESGFRDTKKMILLK
jgi:hypothetical protein